MSNLHPGPRPLGGQNPLGITVESNQHRDCFSIRCEQDGNEDLIHFCDWPAMKSAIDAYQLEDEFGFGDCRCPCSGCSGCVG